MPAATYAKHVGLYTRLARAVISLPNNTLGPAHGNTRPLYMSSTLEKYETFLVKNVSTISALESSLRSVTWFLPGRFKDADLASESRQYLHCYNSVFGSSNNVWS